MAEQEYPVPGELDEGYYRIPDIKHEFVTRQRDVGIGRNAIEATIDLTDDALAHDGGDRNRKSIFKPTHGDIIRHGAGKVRKAFKSLDKDRSQMIYGRLEGSFAMNALYDHEIDTDTGAYTENESLASRMTKRSIKKFGRHVVSDATVVNFTEAIMAKTLSEQRELDDKVDAMRDVFATRVHHAVNEWGLSRRALRMLESIDEVDVLQDDMFETTFTNRDALYRQYRSGFMGPRIIVAPERTLEGSLEETLTHEWSHALSNDSEAPHSRRIMLKKLFGDQGGRALNEALTEHFAQCLIDGDFDVIDPKSRRLAGLSEGTYFSYRRFLDTLLNKGQIKIDIRDTYDGLYFTQQDDVTQFEKGHEVVELLDKFNQAYPGLDIIGKIKSLKNDEDVDKLIDDMEKNEARVTASVTREYLVQKYLDSQLVSKTQHWGNEFDDK